MGNETTNDLQTELLEISTKLNQAEAIFDAFGDAALMTKKTLDSNEAKIITLNHEKNGYLYYSAYEYLHDAVEKLEELVKAI